MHSQGRCRRGRASLVAASLLAVVVCAVLLRILFWGDSGAPSEKSAPPAPAAPSEAVATAGSGDATGAPAAPDAAAPGGEGAQRARVFGTVSDKDGTPLGAMRVRWVPAPATTLKLWSHDANAFGETGGTERILAAEVRAALVKSLAATTGDDGAYELEIPEAESRGSIIVAGAGYETQVKEVAASVEKEAPVAGAPPDFAAAPAPREFEVSFVLEPGGAISGTVLDRETRAPAAGMIVFASVLDPQASPMTAFVRSDAPFAVVGADGAYALQGLPLGEYRALPRSGDSEYVSVGWKDGRRVVLGKGAEAAGVDFLVSRGGAIFGVVSGSDQQALAGVRVRVMPADIMSTVFQDGVAALMEFDKHWRRTGDDGAYEYRGLPLDKEYRISAEKEGFARLVSEGVALSAARPRAEVNLLLTEGCRISGLVTHPDETVAPGVAVYLTCNFAELASGEETGKTTVTDEAGAFAFEHLGAGERQLSVAPPAPFASQSQERTKSVILDGVTDVTGVVLVIEKTAGETALAGVVLDTWGAPIEDAQVSASHVRNLGSVPSIGQASALTNAEGKFVLNGLEGESFKLRASKPGYSSATAPDVPAGTQTVELRLAKHGRISGRIVTGAGEAPGAVGKVFARPIAKASLLESLQEIQTMFAGGRGEDTTETREDGSYSVSAPVGKVAVQARVPGFAPGCSDTIEVVAGQDYHGVKIVVTAGAVVRGRVTLGDGAPVEGAAVRVERKGDDDGNALLKKLLPQFFDVEAPEGSSDAGGGFLVEHLAEGEYLVSAVHARFAPSEAVPVALSRDQVSAPITLVLRRGGVIEGVTTEGGAPKAAALAQIVSVSAAAKQSMTDGSGKFRFENLIPGRYTVVIVDLAAAQKGKFSVKTRTVAVEDGQTSGIEVEFGKGFKVFGKVKGLPAGPVRVLTLRRPGGPAPEDVAVTDVAASLEASAYQVGVGMVTQDDAYEIADIDPGAYILEAPRMPADPTDLEAYAQMEDRKPLYRAEITVEDRDLRHDVEIR